MGRSGKQKMAAMISFTMAKPYCTCVCDHSDATTSVSSQSRWTLNLQPSFRWILLEPSFYPLRVRDEIIPSIRCIILGRPLHFIEYIFQTRKQIRPHFRSLHLKPRRPPFRCTILSMRQDQHNVIVMFAYQTPRMNPMRDTSSSS